MSTIKSEVNLYNLVETHLRKAAKDTKPVSINQLYMQPDVHKTAYDKQQVRSVVDAFRRKEVLVEFARGAADARQKAFAWLDDAATPDMIHRLQHKRHKQKPSSNITSGFPQGRKPDPLYAAMGTDHVLNAPHGTATVREASTTGLHNLLQFIPIATTAIKYGGKVEFHNNEAGKLVITITEQ